MTAPSTLSPDQIAAVKRRMRAQAMSIAMAVAPFGLAFGVACSEADLSLLTAAGYSSLVFTGGSQFAAVGVLGDGGTASAAIIAGLLVALRSLAYGVVMAPALADVRPARRALYSQIMIDEAMAVAVTHPGAAPIDRHLQRYGYLWGGGSIFVLWNVATLLGSVIGSSANDWIERLGIDATIPASFLALVWPRLSDPTQRRVALGGAVIAGALIPLAPAGIPIIAAGLAAVLAVRSVRPTPIEAHATGASV